MLEINNETNLNINVSILDVIINDLGIKRNIELNICSNRTIKKYNKDYRNKDISTDVLSFPFEEINNEPLGCIVISSQYVQEKAKEFNHSLQDEFNLLFIHGLLHLLGFDHEDENDHGKMREEEKRIIEKYKLPKSLIVRNNQ